MTAPIARQVLLMGGPRGGDRLPASCDRLIIAERNPSGTVLYPPGARPVGEFYARHGTYAQKPNTPDVFSWRGWDDDTIADRCVSIADQVVPEYRGGDARRSVRSYGCGSWTAKRWQAAWDGACLALGGDPADYRR